MSKTSFFRQWVFLCLILAATIASAAPHGHYPVHPNPPLLGARVMDMASPELEGLGLDHGVRVVEILPEGPAAEAGLLPGDILTSVQGKMVYSVERLAWLLHQADPNKAIKLEYQRGAQQKVTNIQLHPPILPTPWPEPAQGVRLSYLGVKLQTLNADLRETFGAPPEKGVLVSRVMDQSPAKKAGIQAGDVIVRLDRKSIQTVTDLRRAVAYFEPGDRVEIEIIRDSSPRTLNLTLEARPSPQDQALRWQHPQGDDSLREMLPPPEYWRLLMDRMMRSLQDSWGDMKDRWPKDEKEYY